MLKSDLVQTDKHSIIILLLRKNLRFLRRTNHIQTRCATFLTRPEKYYDFLPPKKLATKAIIPSPIVI